MPTLSSRLLSERQQQQQSAADNEIKEDSLVGKIVRGFSIAFNAVYAPVAVVMISLHWGDAPLASTDSTTGVVDDIDCSTVNVGVLLCIVASVIYLCSVWTRRKPDYKTSYGRLWLTALACFVGAFVWTAAINFSMSSCKPRVAFHLMYAQALSNILLCIIALVLSVGCMYLRWTAAVERQLPAGAAGVGRV